MSAENELHAFRMENGEYWIVNRRCGDTVVELQGECGPVAKCATYEEAKAAFRDLSDEDSPNYVYTEHGGDLPTREDLDRAAPRFLQSTIVVKYDRPCGCVDYRDLGKKRWEVRECRDLFGDDFRVIGTRLWYAQALTLAHAYAIAQPGECRVTAPTHFRSFRRYDRHDDCLREDHWRLCLPRGVRIP